MKSRYVNPSNNHKQVKEVFHKNLGLTDRETVAMIGAGHSVGGAHKSGITFHFSTMPANLTNLFLKNTLSLNWTKNATDIASIGNLWFTSNYSLFRFNTDMEMKFDKLYNKYSQSYIENQTLLLEDFAKVFKKVSEYGLIEDY